MRILRFVILPQEYGFAHLDDCDALFGVLILEQGRKLSAAIWSASPKFRCGNEDPNKNERQRNYENSVSHLTRLRASNMFSLPGIDSYNQR